MTFWKTVGAVLTAQLISLMFSLLFYAGIIIFVTLAAK